MEVGDKALQGAHDSDRGKDRPREIMTLDVEGNKCRIDIVFLVFSILYCFCDFLYIQFFVNL